MKYFLILSLIFIITVISSVKSQENPEDNELEPFPISQISNGKLRGSFGTNGKGDKIYHFKGIPYGHVSKRFAESEEYSEKWGDVIKDASNFGPVCKQYNFFTKSIDGHENCLFLNVYSKNISSGAKLPVLFFIHGGGFVFGSSNQYEPKFLLNEDVVVVTINYRLGPLGFLNAGVKNAVGNMALKDMVLALKWVQKNIEAFGGNPEKVTIFGESAGSAGVAYLVLSPSAKGLFSGAIGQSGSNFASWAYVKTPWLATERLAHKLDCPTSNRDYMIECLQRIDGDQMLMSLNQSVGLEGNLETGHDVVYGGSVETYITPNAFLTKEPEKIYENKEFNNVPLLLGVNKDEGLIFGPMSILTNPRVLNKWNNEYNDFFPKLFKFRESSMNRCGLSQSLWNAYFPQGEKVGPAQSNDLANLFSDSVIVSGVRRFAKLHSDNGGSVYLYHFALKGDTSLTQFFAMLIPGNNASKPEGELYDATHGDELVYLFNMPELYPFAKQSPRFLRDSDRIVKLWTSFAKNGKPTELWGSEMKDWKKFDSSEPTWVEINEEIQEMKEGDIFGNRMKFWETFFDEIY